MTQPNDKKTEPGPSKQTSSTPRTPVQEISRLGVTVYRGDKDRPTTAEWCLIVVTFVLAVLNYFTVKYAGDQTTAAINASKSAEATFELSKRTADSSDASSSKTLAIAQRSITLAENSLAISRKGMENYERISKVDLRPYIVIDQDTIDVSVSIGKRISTRFGFTNVGRTPALDCFHANSCVVADSMRQFALDKLFQTAEWHKKEGIALGSNIHKTKEGTYGVFSLQDSIDVATGTKKLIFFGLISYNDVFGDRHFTWYCLKSDNRGYFTWDARFGGMN
jgi:hypothetical protein